MGKPLSRPDCLRHGPPCLGKAEEEDLNIEDCYVPQRSIYDTVRLNEQIDSGSKGSLVSRHFAGTLPYSQRTLALTSLCGNGVLASSSAFELRSREAVRLDERAVFDGLKLNGDVIRIAGTVLPKGRLPGERKDPHHHHHRRSWRTLAPVGPNEYGSRSGTVGPDGVESCRLGRGGRGRSATNSLTSEEDSGLCSPTPAPPKPGTGTRSCSSSEGVHVSGELTAGRSLSSGQDEFPFTPAKEALPVTLYYSDIPEHAMPPENGICLMDCGAEEWAGSSADGQQRGAFGEGWDTTVERGHVDVDLSCSTYLDYNELPTAELLEESDTQEDCELISVVVTQPESRPPAGALVPEERGDGVFGRESGGRGDETSDSSLADLDDFLWAVEREVCLANGPIVDEEMERLLSEITACSEIDLVSPQVPPYAGFYPSVTSPLLWSDHGSSVQPG